MVLGNGSCYNKGAITNERSMYGLAQYNGAEMGGNDE